MSGDSKCRSVAGRIFRIAGTVIGIGVVVYILLFSGIYPRQTVFELGEGSRASASEYRKGDLARLRLLTRCIGHIKSDYVVPDRVRPVPMMAGALKAAEALVPDLMITFNNPDPEKATSVEVRIGDLTRIFPLDKMGDLYQMNWRLVDIFEFISPNLPSDVKPEEVEYAAINGMLQPLDEHSVYLPPEAYQQMQLDTQGRFGGLGIVISSRNGYVTIMSVMADTPAHRAALKTGDQVVEINQESTMNMPLTEAVSKLRGDPGTKVELVVDRKGWSEPRTISIERAEIKVQSVKTEVLGNGIGYAKLVHFQEDTARELARQLEELRRKGSLKGLVLDLRENPGGLLDQAVEVGDLFLKSGVVVVTEGEGGRLRQAFEADRGGAFENLPVVVLVDGGSASAAEIVAGALKYNDRAILVGSTTFGKGTVQVMHEVGDGALKLTVAQYLIPGDLSIQGVGVVPDIELVPTSIGKKNIMMGLTDYKRFMDPSRRLDAFGKLATDIPVQVIPYLMKGTDEDDDNDVLEELPVEDDAFKRDEAIDLATGILGAVTSFADVSRRAELKNGERAALAWKKTQDATISANLVEKGVDWTSGPVVPNPSVAVGFSAGNAPLLAGTPAVVNMSVTNRGDKPLYRVRASMKSDNLTVDGREFIFGRIDPGATVSREVQFKVPRETWERRDQIEVSLYQDAVESIPSGTRQEYVSFAPVERPRFGYAEELVDRDGNGDGILNPGEKADLVFAVTNVGSGDAPRVMASVSNKSGESLYLRSGRETIKEGIKAGQSRTVRFNLENRGSGAGRNPAAGGMKVEFSVFDLAVREYLAEEITLPSSDAPGPAFVSKPGVVRTLKPGVRILAAATRNAAVIGEVKEGAALRSSGYFPGFFKIDLADGLQGFVVSTDVMELGADARTDTLPVLSGDSNVAPLVDVSFTNVDGPSPMVRVKGKIQFFNRNDGVARKILVFRENDKVYFWTGKGGQGDGTIEIDTQVKLRKGRNGIAVYAVEGKDRSSVRRYNVFQPGDVTAAPIRPTAQPANGLPASNKGF